MNRNRPKIPTFVGKDGSLNKNQVIKYLNQQKQRITEQYRNKILGK